MDKGRRASKILERCKDVLILLLTCSAIWLAGRSQLLGDLGGLLQEDAPLNGAQQTQTGERIDAARPLRITATLPGQGRTARYGVQHDAAGANELFQQVAGLLVEGLSSAGPPEKITRTQWEQALVTAPGVSLDFQGSIPMSVLVGWLAREETPLTGVVRRVSLTLWQESVALYFKDETDGSYYRCLSEVANQTHLAQTVAMLVDNGAVYAFESELYQDLDPDTLITTTVAAHPVYTVSNPMSGGRAALETLMVELGFSVNANSFYAAGNEQVGRSGNDTMRLSASGGVEYLAGEGASGQFQIAARGAQPTLFESVEACRQLAATTLGSRAGQAQLYLSYAKQTENGLEVAFEYALNAVPVALERGTAAHFLVKEGQIVQFKLQFHSYSQSGESTSVLPMTQALAALRGMGLAGQELLLIYPHTAGDTIAAGWAAIAGEG